MATVGLDRFLRVYDTSKTHSTKIDSISGNSKIDCSSKLICSAYLKNRLNCCILADSESKLPKTKRAKKQGELGDDDILNKNVNFDSDSGDDDKDDESNDDSRESDSGEENFDGDSNEDEENGDDSNDGEDDEDDEVEAHEDDDSESSCDESDEELDKKDKKWKGQGENEFSSRKQRVAAVARTEKNKQKINVSQDPRNKKRKI